MQNPQFVCINPLNLQPSMPGTPGNERVVAQPGSVLAWGARGRWFESSPPDFARGYLSNRGLFFFSYSSIPRASSGGARLKKIEFFYFIDEKYCWVVAPPQAGHLHGVQGVAGSLPAGLGRESSPPDSVSRSFAAFVTLWLPKSEG